MNEHIIAVCDNDEKYVVNLCGALIEALPASYRVMAFTKVSLLCEYGGINEIDTLLISESTYDSQVKHLSPKTLIVLRESTDYELSEAILIDRFQSREDIINSVIMNLPECMEGISARRLTNSHWKVIGVYSPIRRCLQSTFALSLGQMLAQNHKVLYMNFENYSCLSGWFETEFNSDILDLIYFYDCDRDKLAGRIPKTIHKIGNLDVLPPARSYYETYETTGKKWIEIIQAIEQVTDYEYLVLDLTDAMQGLLQIMEYCNRIYTLVKRDHLSRIKIEQYEKWMVDHSQAGIIGKTMKFEFPEFEDLPSQPEMLTHCELARYVQSIIDEDKYEDEI